MINKYKPVIQCNPGGLLYHISPPTSLLKTSSRKCKAIYIGLLVVSKIVDKFILMDIEGKILNGIFHFNRLKHI